MNEITQLTQNSGKRNTTGLMSEITQLTQNSEKGNGTIIIKSAQLTKSSWDKINGEREELKKEREKKRKKMLSTINREYPGRFLVQSSCSRDRKQDSEKSE